jgi:hypothetical protein
MEKRPNLALVSRANGLLGTMTRRAIGRVTAGFLLLATPVMAAEPPAELISNFRLKHGEVRVVRDAALDRIALEQARAMAAKGAPDTIRTCDLCLRRVKTVQPQVASNAKLGVSCNNTPL